MRTKEKRFLKHNLFVFAFIVALYLAMQLITRNVMGNEFRDYLFTWEWEEHYNSLEPEQLQFVFDEDGIVSLGEVIKEDGWIIYTLHPEKKGSVIMTVLHAQTGEELLSTLYNVSFTGTISDLRTGNFTNYRMYHLNIVLLCAALTFFLWFSFAYTQKELRYSYQSVFYSGLALWMTLISILLFRVWLLEEVMINVYGIIQSAAGEFMLYTFPPLFIFCIALSISNISLIRHEGFRTRNILGIILSCVMIFGALLYFAAGFVSISGSDFKIKLFNACTGIYGSTYAFMECFLVGAIICGTLAARHEPAYDKDYLIILGCQVKPDGTLYPLIRGRVDRAIGFYQKQLQQTGKEAIFIPSGGKGSDETISEADAMKRYLLEQGISEEQILVENQSENTVQNMLFSKKLIEERTPDAKSAFSTTNFHVFRSGIISRQNQFEPDGMGSPTKWYFWPNAYMREVIGMMAFRWKSLVFTLLPIIVFLVAIQFIG